jgi:hypothetical protein
MPERTGIEGTQVDDIESHPTEMAQAAHECKGAP